MQQDQWGGVLLEETGVWLGDILREAWKRHIPIPDLAELIRRCTRRGQIRAACVAENEDDRRAICEELTRSFGIDTLAFPVAILPRGSTHESDIPSALLCADLIVTTPLHSGPARSAAEVLRKPIVMATLHPDIVAAIERRMRVGPLPVVCADPAFAEQVRTLHTGGRGDRIRAVLADDREAVQLLDLDEPVLLTRAAQDRLGGVALTPLVPFVPFISPDSARQIARLMVRLHMEKEHGAS